MNSETERTEVLMQRFNAVFQTHDPTPLADLVADDCIIENSGPAPDGSRHVGRNQCTALWTSIATASGTRFELEGVEVFDERAIIGWRYWWGVDRSQSVRGINLMRTRDGKIVEARGYAKRG